MKLTAKRRSETESRGELFCVFVTLTHNVRLVMPVTNNGYAEFWGSGEFKI